MRGLKETAMVDLFKLNMDFCETIRWDRKTGSRQPDEMVDQYLLRVEGLLSVIAPTAAHTVWGAGRIPSWSSAVPEGEGM